MGPEVFCELAELSGEAAVNFNFTRTDDGATKQRRINADIGAHTQCNGHRGAILGSRHPRKTAAALGIKLAGNCRPGRTCAVFFHDSNKPIHQ